LTHATNAFLGLDRRHSTPATARYAVLPVPYEGTSTYKLGTAAGPAAILDASQQVELFDEELHGEFISPGITTCPPVPPADTPAGQMRRVRDVAGPLVGAGAFLLALGGEHSITAPLVAACAEVHPDLSVLQIDAHADLRDRYGGSKHSHACVMRRVLETTGRIAQVGVRSYSREEFLSRGKEISNLITPETVSGDPHWIDRTLSLLSETVYVTIDIDGLDPSIAPGVGTPEPGGLTWQQVTALLRRLCACREVVAADVVEVRPIPPNHVTEFVAARLAYKIIAYTQRRAGWAANRETPSEEPGEVFGD